jgi:prepilin-type N-terminal cleavage/methylation domain-containing protein
MSIALNNMAISSGRHTTQNVFKQLLGFTLAEILVALVILGLAAGFTIPKLLTATGNTQTKAILKEHIAQVNQVLYAADLDGILIGTLSEATLMTYLKGKFNYISSCYNTSAGCSYSTSPHHYPGYPTTWPTLIFADGATLSFVENAFSSGKVISIVIDVNGATAPNLPGEDELLINYCRASGTGTCTDGIIPNHPAFTVYDSCLICGNLWPQNHTLYNSLWQ